MSVPESLTDAVIFEVMDPFRDGWYAVVSTRNNCTIQGDKV